ncbi:MAG: BspA family leucine-rich repeat surface protein [archaeon]|nr:BspA family leucine-rich repeat surface protein [archaeon]
MAMEGMGLDSMLTSTMQIEDKFQLDFYYCPLCHYVPELQLKLDDGFKVDIHCDKCQKPMEKITLSEFIEKTKQVKKKPLCVKDNVHGPKEASKFCFECQQWYCPQCGDEHLKEKKEDHLIQSDGMETKNHCDTDGCKGVIDFYCKQCRKYICFKCKTKAHNHHTVAELEKVISAEEVKTIQDKILKASQLLKNQNNEIEQLFGSFPSKQKRINQLKAEKEKTDSEIIFFLNSLSNTYVALKDFKNFQAMNNLKLNPVDSLISLSQEYMRKKIQDFREEPPSNDEVEVTGPYIDCTFVVRNSQDYPIYSSNRFDILGTKFKGLNSSNCAMFINGQSVGFKTKLDREGLFKVRIMLREGTKIESLKHMFALCVSLRNIDLSHFDFSAVKDMSYMFEQCKDLSKIDFSGCDTKTVENMSYMFNKCAALVTLNMSGKFSMENVKTLKGMFNWAHVLNFVDMSNCDTRKVTDMSDMFRNCPALSTVDFSGKFSTQSVVNMSHMFFMDKSLKNLNLMNWKLTKVQTMRRIFAECYALSSITYGNDFNTMNVNETGDIFENCPLLSPETKKQINPKGNY